jgi:hypothetical protein
MNERKKLTMISVLEIVVEASPFIVPEETLFARAALRSPRPTLTEVRDACLELEEKHRAMSRDVAPVTETVRFAATANSEAILRALREG